MVPAGGAFDHVVVKLGTYGRPGPAVAVEVRELGTQRVLGRGLLGAGYPDVERAPEHSVAVGEVPAGKHVAVCVIDRGEGKVGVYGSGDIASRRTSATLNGKPIGLDMTMRFERSPRSLLSLVPRMFDRASLFKTGWAGGWTFWLLAALVLLAVPALLVRAVARLPE